MTQNGDPRSDVDARRRRAGAPAARTRLATLDPTVRDGMAETGDVERLVENGMSRLAAQRLVEIARDGAEPGRARPHALSRR
jgi:hypothetical protein